MTSLGWPEQDNPMSREFTLRTYLNDVKKGYDYILIDCMPSLGMLNLLRKMCTRTVGKQTIVEVEQIEPTDEHMQELAV